MEKCNSNFAIETAIKLAEVNIQNAGCFLAADAVTDFIEEVYCFLTGEEASSEGGA